MLIFFVSDKIMLQEILKNEPAFRLKQIKESMFDAKCKGWQDITALPKNLRAELENKIPWLSVEEKNKRESKQDGTLKSLLKLKDGFCIETVAMPNTRDAWTLCLSSQAGCPVGCAFCATGKMGFKRNLEREEIIDQYRYWMYQGLKITNIVLMGMGEPFLNYENVRDAFSDILQYSGVGANHIVISTVGIMDKLNYLLEDKLWPNVRIAISLHSAISETRKKLVPCHPDNFYQDLITWANEYARKLGARNRYLSFEYVMLKGINDSEKELNALIDFLQGIGDCKVNLLVFNDSLPAKGKLFSPAAKENILYFQNEIQNAGFVCTIRKSFGVDIQGACGQLAAENFA